MLFLLKLISLTVSGDIQCSVKTWETWGPSSQKAASVPGKRVFLHQRCLWASLPLSRLGSVASRSSFLVFYFTNSYLYGLEKLFFRSFYLLLEHQLVYNNNDNINSSLLIKCFWSILNYLQFSNEPPNIAWLENMTVKTNFSARYSCSSGTVFLWYNKLFKAISHYSKAEYKYKSHLCFYSKTMYYKELSCLEIPERLFGAAVSTLQRIPIACSVFLSILLWRYG